MQLHKEEKMHLTDLMFISPGNGALCTLMELDVTADTKSFLAPVIHIDAAISASLPIACQKVRGKWGGLTYSRSTHHWDRGSGQLCSWQAEKGCSSLI